MLFNKDIIKKEGEEEIESENNNELTEQDYIQINKDISNLFKNIYHVENIKENFNNKEEAIEMSDECKNNLKDINKIS